MQGDFTRWTFDPDQGFRSVLLQQGRVLLDADFNEQTEITAHHDEARSQDVVGRSGGPVRGAGFAIVDEAGAPPAGTRWADLRITPGTYYVDGILAEAAVPPPVAGVEPAGWRLADQPYLPRIGSMPGLAEPDDKHDRYAVFLDVWTHHVSADEEPRLRESALGGPDTTTRARTVWQVRITPIETDQQCSDLHPASAVKRVAGTMTAGLQALPPDADPCRITASGGYQLLENQLYRVQIHDTSGPAPRFLWSRENASVVAGLTGITTPSATPGMAADLLLDRVGRDEELSIKAGDTVEVTSTDWQLHGRPGELAVAGAPDGLRLPVTWVGAAPSELGAAPIVRRWEGPARDVGAGPLNLEGGIQVGFPGGGHYRNGDYWLIPARAVRLAYGLDAESGMIDWPTGAGGAGLPQPPLGLVHHLTPLAILVRKSSQKGVTWTIESDCRLLFPQLTEQVTIDLLGGDGQEARPGEPMPQPVRIAVRNGGLPVPGARVLVTTEAGGHLAVGSESSTSLVASTDSAGVIEVRWMLAQTGPPTQTLRAQRLDDHGGVLDPAVVVTGRLSIAREVAYTSGCTRFAELTTVQDALDRLATTRELRLLGGDGQHVPPGRVMVPQPVRVIVDSPCGPVEGAVVIALSAGQQGLVAEVKKGEKTTPATLEGTGATFQVRTRTGPDGVAAFFWQPDFRGGPSTTLSIGHDDATGAPIVVSAQRVADPTGPAVSEPRVTAVRAVIENAPVANGERVLPRTLAGGLRAVFRGARFDFPVAPPQLMHVILDLPWPTTASEREWVARPVGYRSVELEGQVTVEPEALLWTPASEDVREFFKTRLWEVIAPSSVTGWITVEEWALAADPTSTRGRFVQWFTLSQGLTLPDVVGRTQAVAERLLTKAGLAVSIDEAPDEQVRKGLVISTDTAPGTEVLPGATVTVLVSSGRAP